MRWNGARQVLLEAAEQAALSADGAQLTYLRVEPGKLGPEPDACALRWQRRAASWCPPLSFVRSPHRVLHRTAARLFSALPGTRQNQDALVQQGAGVVLAHGDPWHIWQLTLADGELTRLTDVPLDGPALAWSPGGGDGAGSAGCRRAVSASPGAHVATGGGQRRRRLKLGARAFR